MENMFSYDGEFEYCLANQRPPPANIVIFGATGDLAQRKLAPSLARMLRCNLLHPDSRIIGVVRRDAEQWVRQMRRTLIDPEHGRRLGHGARNRVMSRHRTRHQVTGLRQTFHKMFSGESYSFAEAADG